MALPATHLLFGTGALGATASLLVRLPALERSMNVIHRLGELATRVARTFWTTILYGIDYAMDNQNRAPAVDPKRSTLDFRDQLMDTLAFRKAIPINELSSTVLLVSLVADTAIAGLWLYATTYVCGPLPVDKYNNILQYFGPIRLSNDSWPTLMAQTFAYLRGGV